MVSVSDVEAGIAVAEAIVDAIVKVAPAIEEGVVASTPYVKAIARLIQGTNASQTQIDQTLAAINAASDAFLAPLAADDGSTTT